MKHYRPALAPVAVFAALVALVGAWNSVASAAENPAATAGDTDWNQWRGPNRNGIAPDSPKLADAWGPSGPVQLWQSEEKIPGDGNAIFTNYGSPVVAKGRVYLYVHWTGYQDQPGAADVVVCLDANTGKTLWKTSFPGVDAKGCYSSTPCVIDGKVYAVGSNGMYCLNAETGKEIWKTPSLGKGVSSSPAIVDGVLVVCAGSAKHLNVNATREKESGLLKGFDPATGKELWACPEATSDANRNGDVNASAGVWVTDKGPRIIMNTGKLTCVNPKDGAVIWQGEAAYSPGTPAIVGDVCIAAGKVAAYRLRPDKAEKLFGSESYDRAGSYLLYDGHVYAALAGMFRCSDLTGKTLWQKTLGGMVASPIIAGGKVFWINGSKDARDMKLYMFSATPAMPAKFYAVGVPASKLASPAICGGRLFLRLQDGVGCYDLTKLPADAEVASTDPAPASASASAPAAKALITFVDVSPPYPVHRKAIASQAWPPEIEAEAAKLDWAVNQPLSADGTIDFVEVLDARGMATRDAVIYARAVLEAATPGRVALSLTVQKGKGDVTGLAVWVNGANVLRHDVAHGRPPQHEELVVDLVAGRNALLFRGNSSGGPWFMQVQAKALDGLVVQQVAAKEQAAPVPAAAPAAAGPAAAPAAGPAANWPCFRGGTGGVSQDANTAVSWNAATGEGILWKADVPLPGASSPIVCGGRVLVSGASGDEAGVFCFDLKSGQKLWQGEVSLTGKPDDLDEAVTYAAPTPVADGRQVYAVFADGTVAAFSLEGKPAWTASLGLPDVHYGYASSPALHKDRLLIQLDQEGEGRSALIALDTRTGKEAWRVKRSLGSSWSSPLVIETAKGPHIITAARDGVAAHDPKDGHEIWIVKKGASDLASSPVPAGDKVVVTLGFTGTLAIRTDGAGDVTATHVAWVNDEAGAEVASPVVSGDRVFVATGVGLVCLNVADGMKAETSKARELGGQVYASPLLAGDKLYVVNREGVLTVFKAVPTLDVLGTIAIGEAVDASPAVANGHLLIRTAKRLLCIQPAAK